MLDDLFNVLTVNVLHSSGLWCEEKELVAVEELRFDFDLLVLVLLIFFVDPPRSKMLGRTLPLVLNIQLCLLSIVFTS